MSDLIQFEFSSSSKTSVGNVRSINEDSCFDNPSSGIWAVADGMGGHQSGDLASRLIAQSLAVVNKGETLQETIAEVKDCLIKANMFLLDEAALRTGNPTIGSTVVVFIIHGQQCAVLWVGDSRLYRLRAGQLNLLTSDHSQVQELVDLGVIQPEDAESHPAANVITRAIGASSTLLIDEEQFDLEVGDTFLICSDGLYKELNDAEITSILLQHHNKSACDKLLEASLNKTCRDNVTAVVIDVFISENTVLREDV